jgi:site-specific DNA-methyltransferase (adenine-specific)
MTYVPTMSQVEMAVTSFDSPARLVKINSNQSDRIHPTQKPIKLYQWLLNEYAETGDKILDTHLGSGSIAIACWDMGFDLTAYEIDKDYYDKACKRFEQHSKQMPLW